MLHRVERSSLLIGLTMVAVVAAVYPFIADQADNPLGLFVLPPLFTAVLSTSRSTAVVGIAAGVVAAVEGAATGLVGWSLAMRLVIVIGASVLAGVAAEVRRTRDQELADARVHRAVSESFQSGLVPVPLPPVGLLAETRYRPGEQRLRLGGDFVDLITLPDGAAGFVIGDVSGHGARAAAFGTAIRAAWKGIAHALPADPVRWLAEVEAAYLTDGRFDGFVTALAGRLDAHSGRLELVSAGHCWPVLVANPSSLVPVTPNLPLGIDPSRARSPSSIDLPATRSLLLYTDGLIENRSAPQGRADEEGLLQAVTRRHDHLDLDELLDELGPDGFEDDVALMLLTRRSR